jgi:hypothetical protein
MISMDRRGSEREGRGEEKAKAMDGDDDGKGSPVQPMCALPGPANSSCPALELEAFNPPRPHVLWAPFDFEAPALRASP